MKAVCQRGFTLVEIMIVVAIVGLLTMISVPHVRRAHERARAAAIANDFRLFSGAFEIYAMENGTYPGEMEGPHFMAPDQGINAYLEKEKFTNPKTLEGGYDWDGPDSHAYYGISVRPWQVSTNICGQIDALMDDGNVSQGSVRYLYSGARFAYVVYE